MLNWTVYEPGAFALKAGSIRITSAVADRAAEPLLQHLEGPVPPDDMLADSLTALLSDYGGPLASVVDDIVVLTEPDHTVTSIMTVDELADYQVDSSQLDYAEQYEDLTAFMLCGSDD